MNTLHPGFDRLRAYSGAELPASARERVAGHLAGCPECRREVARIDELRRAAAEVTAPPLPPAAREAVLARHRAGDTVLLPVPGSGASAPRAGRRGWGRAAALLLFASAGIASATLPGSPVRGWWERVRADAPPAALPASPEPATGSGARPAAAAMSVAPVEGAVRISVVGADPAARIRVRISASGEARVEARGGAAGALLRTSAGRIEVVDAGPGVVWVELPESLDRATLLVDGVPYLSKEGRTLRVLAPEVDTVGTELVFGVPRGSSAPRNPRARSR